MVVPTGGILENDMVSKEVQYTNISYCFQERQSISIKSGIYSASENPVCFLRIIIRIVITYIKLERKGDKNRRLARSGRGVGKRTNWTGLRSCTTVEGEVWYEIWAIPASQTGPLYSRFF